MGCGGTPREKDPIKSPWRDTGTPKQTLVPLDEPRKELRHPKMDSDVPKGVLAPQNRPRHPKMSSEGPGWVFVSPN